MTYTNSEDLKAATKGRATLAVCGSALTAASLSLLLLLLGTSSATHAADVVRGQLEEVIVTATKRGDVDLQSVPLSISAVTSDTLTRAGANSVDDVARLVPSLSLTPTGTGQYEVRIRGVTNGPFSITTTQFKPLTAIYFDEMPVSFGASNPNIDPFDVQRVEVLRGPQGTLYGTSSMGGNIRFVFNQPDTTEFAGKAELTTGYTDHGEMSYGGKAMLNVPVNDQFALRFVGSQQRLGGWVDMVNTGRDDANRIDRTSLKASARYIAGENWTITGNLLWQDSDTNAPDTVHVLPPNPDFTQQFLIDQPYPDTMTLANLTVEGDLGWATLTSSTSYFPRRFNRHWEVPIFGEAIQKAIATPCGTDFWRPECVVQPAVIYNRWHVYNSVEELRLNSKGDSRLDWVAGIFLSHEKQEFTQDYPVPNFSETTGIPTAGFGAEENNLFKSDVSNVQKQLALFGELGYRITDKLKATAGLRWFTWEQDYDLVYAGFFNGGVSTDSQVTKVDKFTSKFNLSYDVSDRAMVYATASQGFRLGGFNDPVPTNACGEQLAFIGLTSAPRTFGPETLWNYELGAKTSWLDRRLTVNGALYRLEWEDIQTIHALNEPTPCGFGFSENAGSQRSDGVELEIVAAPVPGLTVSVSGAYTDAKLSTDNANLGAAKGTRAPQIPELAGAAAVDYSMPLFGDVTGFVRADVQYVDGRWTSYQVPTRIFLPAYTEGNLSFGIDRGPWQVALSVRNLWNERAILNQDDPDTFFGAYTQQIDRPRTVQLAFRTSF